MYGVTALPAGPGRVEVSWQQALCHLGTRGSRVVLAPGKCIVSGARLDSGTWRLCRVEGTWCLSGPLQAAGCRLVPVAQSTFPCSGIDLCLKLHMGRPLAPSACQGLSCW